MRSLPCHLSVLQEIASRYPERPAFKLAGIQENSNATYFWKTVTYRRFSSEVNNAARYWLRKLTRVGISQGSVVGFWYVIFSVLMIIRTHLINTIGLAERIIPILSIFMGCQEPVTYRSYSAQACQTKPLFMSFSKRQEQKHSSSTRTL